MPWTRLAVSWNEAVNALVALVICAKLAPDRRPSTVTITRSTIGLDWKNAADGRLHAGATRRIRVARAIELATKLRHSVVFPGAMGMRLR